MNNKFNYETKWFKLDNTAIIFPVISNKRLSSVFRVSVTLKQDIIPNILEKSLEETLHCFNNFNVKLKRGLFWYYFETNKKLPVIQQEQDYPCTFIDSVSNNQFLFKVTYFKKRINLEVFHAITDGEGAVNFLKALTFNYIKLANKNDLSEQALKIPCVEVYSNSEDSYIKNYKKARLNGLKITRAYRMIDKKIPLSIVSTIHGYIDTTDLLNICREKNVTITQYLSTILIWCIYKEYLNGQSSKYPINISIPVNLRNFFGSTTSTNFFSIFSVKFTPKNEDHTFDEILESISNQFKEELTKENLSKKISLNVSFEKNIFIRCIPLFVKNFILKIIFKISEKTSTSVLSNLGKIEVPSEFEKYIDDFSLSLGITESESVKCGVCSYGNKLVCTFTSKFETPYLERAFFRYLQSEGLDVVIESNGVHNEDL
jgi:NRPS condensation-like uncharacterized protein